MTFILTEKPSVAKAFAHALAVPFTGSYYENSRYLITNCLGHLFQAFDPKDYEVHYKKWSLSDLPIIPHTIRFKKIEASKKIARQGYARQKTDWLVGINISRLLSLHAKTLLSIGRVQTAVLAEIFRREKEIADFIPTPYYEYSVKIASSEAIFTAKAYKKNETALITPAFQNDCFTPDRFSKNR